MSRISAILVAISMAMPAYAQQSEPVHIVIDRVHFGSAACQIQESELGKWFGVKPDTLPKLGQCLALMEAWARRSSVIIFVSSTGNVVPCNVSVCEAATVPEISDIRME